MSVYNNEMIHDSHQPPKRNLFIILPKMINLIPDNQDNFKSELKYQLEKAAFTAPENIFNIWINVQNIITKQFINYEDQTKLPIWSKDLLDIWTDKKNQQTNSHTS